ncbi:MAG: hypothetical protein H6860_03340 [Rhodospirillales bacterium]|nr:hypothetical protein [Alphaproteobacteria bacterium]MCB9981412.1 hypothetical protein [Rhodospirillales bacterium]
MSIKSWNILLVLALVIVLSGGGYILYQNNQQKQAEIAKAEAEEQARIAEETQRKKQEQTALMQNFEDFLNNFLQDINTQVYEYKQARTVMDELLKPGNQSTPEYIIENARLAEGTVMSLQLQMEDILKQFEKANADLKPLIEKLTPDSQDHVRQTWNKIRNENAEKFMAFFESDQEVLSAQLKLIEFYKSHAQILHADIENQRITFDDISLQEQEALLRAKIMATKAAQKDLFKKIQETNKTAQ